MIPVSYIITKYIFESKKNERWRKIRNFVLFSLNKQLIGLFIDLSNWCGFDTSFSLDKDLSKKEWVSLEKKILSKQLKKLSKIGGLKIRDGRKELILSGAYGNIFKKREIYLNEFQTKYLEYLDAEIIINLIAIQESLHLINQDIIIRNKEITNNWIRTLSDDRIIKEIERYLEIIIINLQKLKELNFFHY